MTFANIITLACLFAWLVFETIWDLRDRNIPIWFSLAVLIPGVVMLAMGVSVWAAILMGISMFISTKMTATTGMEGSQKMILYFMPVMFTWICLWAPAGLTLYWLANNILTMGQQALINRQVAQRQEAAAKGRKSTPKGPSRPS